MIKGTAVHSGYQQFYAGRSKEDFRNIRVELYPFASLYFCQSFLAAHGFSIGSAGGHGFVSIGNGNNPGTYRYLILLEAVRITRTVIAFVMVSNDLQYILIAGNGSQDFLADLGMFFYLEKHTFYIWVYLLRLKVLTITPSK